MDEEAQPAGTDPLTVEQLLKSILEVLTCMDSAVHRIEAHLIPDEAELQEAG